MELIKKLPTEKVNNYRISFGLFLCVYCNKKIKKRLSNGRRDKSCGCRINRHGDQSANSKYIKLYIIWKNIKQRCSDLDNKDYGGRGIKVCKEWLEYISFKKWSLQNGYRDNLQIDRIDNDGNYEPSNCRWVTRIENNRNKRNTKLTMKKAKEIKKLYKEGSNSQRELGKLFGVTQTMIKEICLNRQWRNI